MDEAFVKRYFDGNVQAALAGSLGFGSGKDTDIQIVGVIPVIHALSLDSLPSKPFLYLPYDQSYKLDATHSTHNAVFYLRSSSDAGQLPNAVRSVVHQVDPNLPVNGLETMDDHLSGSIFVIRLMTGLAIGIGGLALLLAAIGLYGVLSFSVAQRTKEIGIRMALGASRENISALVVWQVGYLITAGLVAGAGLGWLAVRLLRSEIQNLQRSPLWLFGGTALGLIVVMLVAGYIPARRASSVEPMEALRAE